MNILTVYFIGNLHKTLRCNHTLHNLRVQTMDGTPDRRCIPVEGPGAGHMLDDATLSKKLNWSNAQLSQARRESIEQVVSIIKRQPYELKEMSAETYEQLKSQETSADGFPTSWLYTTYKGFPPNYMSDNFFPDQINLVGWSQGAVSCHMLANAMFDDDQLRGIPVNIFAMDPVLGSSMIDASQVTLSGNVAEYVGVYARDERSSDYAGIVPDTDGNTKVHIYPIAGRHESLIGNPAIDGDKGRHEFLEPAAITHFLAGNSLMRWGAIFELQPLQSEDVSREGLPDHVRSALVKVVADYDAYVLMRSTTYSAPEEQGGQRKVYVDGAFKKFTEAKGTRFIPNLGLAKGKSSELDYYKDVLK